MGQGVSFRTNIASLNAQRRLDANQNTISTSFTRLSSGLRINSAVDDPAGLAVSSKLSTDSRVYGQALRNVNDAISVVNTAEGALNELTNILFRQKELATQASSGSLTTSQRQVMQKESTALSDEYNRIIATGSFNRRSLLNGTFGDLSVDGGSTSGRAALFSMADKLKRTVGTATFNTATTLDAGTAGNAIIVDVGDLNGDGHQDIAVASGSDVLIKLGNGDGTFSAGATLASGGTFSSTLAQVFIEDFNNDGYMDISAIDIGLGVVWRWQGSGTGTFGLGKTFAIGAASGAYSGTTGDFDGDGDVDMIVMLGNDNVEIMTNNGSGNFTAGATFALTGSAYPYDMVTGDVNGDGKLDIVVGGYTVGAGTQILLGNGNGTFTSGGSYDAAGRQIAGVALADLDGDTDLDLIETDITSGNVIVRLNDGNGTFSTQLTMAAGGGAFSIRADDLNGDGITDLLVELSATAKVFIGNGDGTFQTGDTLAPAGANSLWGVGTGDFNEDGVVDYLAGDVGITNASLDIFLGKTTTVTTWKRLDLSTASAARSALSTIDAQINRVALEKGANGSFQTRLEVMASNVEASRDNSAAAASRIRDIDVAQEVTTLTAAKIRQDVTTAVLAQANLQPKIALSLLESAISASRRA